MINFKNDIKEQVNFALRELNSSIDMIYTANNLLTINRILEQMRLQISNLIYLNEIRDKFAIRKPSEQDAKEPEDKKRDTSQDDSAGTFSPLRFKAFDHFVPFPEEFKKSGDLSESTGSAPDAKTAQAKDTEKQVSSASDNNEPASGKSDKKDDLTELTPINKADSSQGSKMSELDRLVSRLIEDTLEKDKDN